MSFEFALTGEEVQLYGALWHQTAVDGVVDAEAAVELLSQSGLDEEDLYQVWELCDPEENGYLEEQSFYTSLKLVALVQAGHEADFANIGKPTPLVDLGEATEEIVQALAASAQQAAPEPAQSAPADVPPPTSTDGSDGPAASDGGQQSDDWEIRPDDRTKFEKIFETLGPKKGVLSGTKSRKILLKSKLPQDVLGRIWEVSDIDQDGGLDKHEFVVAMNLVAKCLEGLDPPESLPASLQKPEAAPAPDTADAVPPPATATADPTTPAETAPQPVKQPPPTAPKTAKSPSKPPPTVASRPAPTQEAPQTAGAAPPSWVVTPKNKKMYDKFFKTADKQRKGVVNGVGVMKIFQKSGLSSEVLAHIWELVDINKSGEINDEQFALAMHLISALKTKSDYQLPDELSPDMVPPSFRGAVPSSEVSASLEPEAPAVAEPTVDTPQPAVAVEPVEPEAPPVASTVDGSPTPAVAPTAQLTPPSQARPMSPEERQAEAMVRAEIDNQKMINAALEAELHAQKEEIDRETASLEILKMELKELKSDESRLRLDIKNGKQQLQGVLAALRSHKHDKGKQRKKIDKLQAMKDKTIDGLNKTSEKAEALRASEVDEGLSAASEAIQANGMSFQDYFGNSTE